MEQQTLFGSALEAAFVKFHQANPGVWSLFRQYTFEIIRAGRRHYSADAILHRIRWHVDLETRGSDRFKINNNHSAYYGRMFMKFYPEHKGFFRVREVKE